MSPSGETPEEKALRAPQLIEECARILVAYWDPIGVMPKPEAIDEYDSHAPSIADALLNGATHEQVEAMLSEIVRREIGLPVDEERTRLAARLLVNAAREWDNDELRVNPRQGVRSVRCGTGCKARASSPTGGRRCQPELDRAAHACKCSSFLPKRAVAPARLCRAPAPQWSLETIRTVCIAPASWALEP